jgi:hypothetical protein
VLTLAKDALGSTILGWTVPSGGIPGSARFDVFRSTTPQGSPCIAGWSCLEGDTADTSTEEGDVPAAGQTFFYLVSAQNACSFETPAQSECP